MFLFSMVNHTLSKRISRHIIVSILVMFSGAVIATEAAEYKIKASFLYQFTKFTQWPNELFDDKDAPIRICVLGKNPFGKELANISGKTSQNRKLVISYLATLQNISDCHIIFISRSEEKKLSLILRQTKHSAILTVSDIDNFSRRGGIIGFFLINDKLALNINYKASIHANLKISSKLLALATIVGGNKK